jgi:ketosteroid isomerase-like protein
VGRAGILGGAVSENIDIVRQIYESGGPLTNAGPLAPDAEFDFTALYPDQPVLRGVEAMRAFRDTGPWGESISFEAEQYLVAGEDTVLVLVRATATGRGSGAPIVSRIAHELTLSDGMIVRVKVHADQTQAMRACGLSG